MTGLKKDEIVWMTYTTENNDKYLITSDKIRTVYKLYKVVNEKAVYTNKKSSLPIDLDEYMV